MQTNNLYSQKNTLKLSEIKCILFLVMYLILNLGKSNKIAITYIVRYMWIKLSP